MRGLPLELAQDPEQGITSRQRPQPYGRLAVGFDCRVQVAHGQERVEEIQAGEPGLDVLRQAGLCVERILLPLQTQARKYRGKLLARQDLGGFQQLKQVETRACCGGRLMRKEGLGPVCADVPNLFLRPIVADKGDNLDLAALALRAAGRNCLDHLVARGRPELVARGDEHGLPHHLARQHITAGPRIVVGRVRALGGTPQHDDPASLVVLGGPEHVEPAPDRRQIERRLTLFPWLRCRCLVRGRLACGGVPRAGAVNEGKCAQPDAARTNSPTITSQGRTDPCRGFRV